MELIDSFTLTDSIINAYNYASDVEYARPDLKRRRKQNIHLHLHKKWKRSGENNLSSPQRLTMAEDQSENNVIIDTDVGVDDTFCMANFLALHRKNRCKVLGENNMNKRFSNSTRAPRFPPYLQLRNFETLLTNQNMDM